MENIGLGIQLMVVGMSTVFLILMILISGGKLLINFVNKVAPEEVVAPKKAAAAAPALAEVRRHQILVQSYTSFTMKSLSLP